MEEVVQEQGTARAKVGRQDTAWFIRRTADFGFTEKSHEFIHQAIWTVFDLMVFSKVLIFFLT